MDQAELLEFIRQELRADAERQARVNANGASHALKETHAGSTLDLSHKHIEKLSEDIVHLIKDNVERLALSHNPHIEIPKQIIQCDRLRYLNLRWNQLEEFPLPVIGLDKLEILDVSKNRLTTLPEEIRKMRSLRFLAFAHNYITHLPLSLGDMASLSKLRFDDNPVEFPMLETVRSLTAGSSQAEKEKDVCMTVKRLLRDHALKERNSREHMTDGHREDVNMPRLRRAATGERFPVKPSMNGVDRPVLETKPTVSTFVGSSITEKPRARACSSVQRVPERTDSRDTLSDARGPLQAPKEATVSASSLQSRRQGFVPRKAQLPDARINVSYETFGRDKRAILVNSLTYCTDTSPRTTSKSKTASTSLSGRGSGFKLIKPCRTLASKSASVESLGLRSRELRHRQILDVARQSKRLYHILQQLQQSLHSMTIEFQKAHKWSLQVGKQVHGSRSSMQELDCAVSDLASALSEHGAISFAQVSRLASCSVRLLDVFRHCVSVLRHDPIDLHSAIGDFQLRTFLHQIFYVTTEANNISANLLTAARNDLSKRPEFPACLETSLPSTRSAQPRTVSNRRLRGASILRSMSSASVLRAVPPPSTSSYTKRQRSVMPSLVSKSGQKRNTSLPGASTDTLNSLSRPTNDQVLLFEPRGVGHEAELEEQFNRILIRLTATCELTRQALPEYRKECSTRRGFSADGKYDISANSWSVAIHRVEAMISANNTLIARLKGMTTRDLAVRSQREFWHLCDSFVNAWADVGLAMQDLSKSGVDVANLKMMMRPVQRSMKETSKIIAESSVYQQTIRSGPNGNSASYGHQPSIGNMHGIVANFTPLSASATRGYKSPVPATPLSAALGPAVQAIVGNTSAWN